VQVTPPAGPAVQRFSKSIERLTGGDGGRLLLAVSGGPDSLALLLMAHAAIPERIAAATVDHGLRPEAAAEAEFVAMICGELGVLHTMLRPEEPITGSVQASARAARYRLLENHASDAGCSWIATAHHADDQLETVLMRIARGAGISGLSAVRARQGKIIRPLLDSRKSELEAICAAAMVEPVRDPSNDNSDFDRVAMRKWLAETAHPFDPLRAVRSASAFADASEALEWATAQLLSGRLQVHEATLLIDVADVPIELRRRLLLRALQQIEPGNMPRGDAVDRALIALDAGERMTLGNVLCEGGSTWTIRPAPKRRH
jgi:tRNA(Ile)-lysidine synthase